MSVSALKFSEDQAEAFDKVTQMLRAQGVDLDEGTTIPRAEDDERVMAIVGRAGSGKTMLLAQLYKALRETGVDVISGDYEARRRQDRRSLAILALRGHDLLNTLLRQLTQTLRLTEHSPSLYEDACKSVIALHQLPTTYLRAALPGSSA